LDDEQKAALYAKRKVDVESVFGNIKGNLSFKRFLLRGLKKVQTEFGIVAIAHNLVKLAGIRLANFTNKEKKRIGKLVVFSIRSFFRDFLDNPFLLIIVNTRLGLTLTLLCHLLLFKLVIFFTNHLNYILNIFFM